MSATKKFCDICIVILVGLHLVLAEEVIKVTNSAPADEGPKGNCSCGGFASEKPLAGTKPLLSQMPGLEVKCNEEGETTCKSLCLALATATKAKGPEIICNRLKVADELKLSAFSQICDRPWLFAGMTSDIPLCCKDSKAFVCPSVEITLANNATESKSTTNNLAAATDKK